MRPPARRRPALSRHAPAGLLLALLGAPACAPDPWRAGEPAADGTAAAPDGAASFTLVPIGRVDSDGATASEIPAYDAGTQRAFVVNGALGSVDVLDLSDPAAPRRIATIAASALGGGAANSVAARDGLVAVAVQAATKTAPGHVHLFRAATLDAIAAVEVGALPDMLAFTPDGTRVVVANEGEPSDDGTIDPPGSVSVVDLRDPAEPAVRTATFDAFNGTEAALRARGVRLAGGGATAAQDLEPEYVAIAPDGRTAWVTLQENNALAVVDLARAVVTDLLPLGEHDHARRGHGFDASDRDGGVLIRPWPVRSLPQPDAIAAWASGGTTYLVHANEGDTRAWGGRDELVRAATLPLERAVLADTVCGGPCAGEAHLGRLHVFADRGRNARTGRHDTLVMSGSRSISIRRADGTLVWDSGDEIERRTARLDGVPFNGDGDGLAADARSDDRGPEPEGLVLGRVGERTVAFVALERTGGVMAWDITTPRAPTFVTYVNTLAAHGDRSPEGLAFVPAGQSPTGRPLLIVGFEVSGTTVVFEVVPASPAP
jgi:hypothetical protein